MPRIALWTFDEAAGSTTAADVETSDGVAQDGIFQNGATTNNLGSGVFDGNNDHVEVPHDPAFQLPTGSVVITFTQEVQSPSNNQNNAHTLFSRDSSGFDGGGHLTIYVRADGQVAVRHQTTADSVDFIGGDITVGQTSTLVYTWSPTGGQLIVDGEVVAATTEALTLEGNSEPITIGAGQTRSGDGVANNLRGFYEGTIDGVAIYDEVVSPTTVPCFTAGTLIETPRGEIPIECLSVGDLVSTHDHGPQPIRWIGSRRVRLSPNPAFAQKLRPVRISRGALGAGLPHSDLLVSRQHRIVVSSSIAAEMFDSRDIMIPAIKLTGLDGVRIDHEVVDIEYFHILLDLHEVIFAHGTPTESLLTGFEAIKSLPPAARAEIQELFPELGSMDHRPQTILPVPIGRLQKKLIARHVASARSVLENWKRRAG